MEQKKKTFEELIDGKLAARVKDFKEVIEAKDPSEKLNDVALWLSRNELYRLELSYGGPQESLEFEYNPKEKILVDITYHYLDDWHKWTQREVYKKISYKSDREIWDILEEVFNSCLKIE